jgi:hypothetical protein
MAKAKAMRALANDTKDPAAKQDFLDASARYEKRAARGAKKVARIRRKRRPQVLG